MGDRSYKRIGAVQTSIRILRYLADRKEPASGAELARAMDLPVGTVMCHLMTLEDERIVRKIGDHWELGDGLALFWARRKAQLEGGIDRMKGQLRELGVENG